MATNPYSLSEIRQLARAALPQPSMSMDGYVCDNVWIRDVYFDAVIWQDETTSQLYRLPYEVGEDQKLVFGTSEAVLERRVYETMFRGVDYELDESVARFTEDEEFIYKSGKIFEAGVFRDKKFKMTPEELAQAVTEFEECDLDIEHSPSPLDGKLGKLKKIWLSEDGETLFGTVAIPKWLDAAWGGVKKVSCTWLTEPTKKLVGLAMVNNPRIEDAVLMGAFSRSKLKVGEPGPEITIATAKQELNMPDTTATTAAEVAQDTANVAEFARLRTEMEALQRQNARLLAERRRANAVSFADQMISELRALPAEKDYIVAVFNQLALDDEGDEKPAGLVAFSGGRQASRVEAFQALFLARPARTELTEETVSAATDDKAALFAKDKTGTDPNAPMSAERRAQLLGLSTIGQSVLADKR